MCDQITRAAPTFVGGISDIVGIGRRYHKRLAAATSLFVIGCCLLWVFVYCSADQRALRRIAELGGITSGSVRSPYIPRSPANSPLRARLSKFTERMQVYGISVPGMAATDADVELFAAAFPDCRSLTLNSTGITDASLARIAESCPGLYILRVSGTSVSDVGVAALTNQPELYELDLARTQITDAALSELSKWPRLQTLSLAGTGISDIGLQSLKDRRISGYLRSWTSLTHALPTLAWRICWEHRN